MNRNTRTLRINGKTINFYDYYITNACVISFVDVKIDEVKSFFGTNILTGFDELDELGDVIKSESFYFKRKQINIENTTITETEEKLIKEAWDEKVVDEHGKPVIDEETGQQIVIHHDAEYQTIEHKIPVEMTTVYLETPEISDELSSIKEDVTDVKKDIDNVKQSIEEIEPSNIDVDKFNAILFIAQNTAQTLEDDQALIVKDIYKTWDNLVEEKFVAKTKGFKFTHKDVLYKTIQDNISFQSNWVPGEGTESMFDHIDETHAGTKEDPIPYFVNMEVFKGKYYTENGILYKCTRDSQIALHNKASELVGHYFEIVK